MPSPTILAPVTLAPLPGTVVIELDLQLALVLVERLLGSKAREALIRVDSRRPTELEIALVRDLLQVATDGVAGTVAAVAEVTGELNGLEFNPQMVQVAAPSDRMVVLSYRVHVTGSVQAEGLVSVCYPASMLPPLLDGLRQHPAADHEPVGAVANPLVSDRLRGVEVSLSVALAESTLPATALAALREGDVLRLDHRVDRPVRLLLDRRLLPLGHAGRRGRRLAVQIAGWAGPPTQSPSLEDV